MPIRIPTISISTGPTLANTSASGGGSTYALARRWGGQGIHANAFHPGLLKTNLMQAANPLLRWLLRAISASPARAAEALADLALAPEFADTNGQFYTFRSLIASNAYSHDPAVQDRLWDVSLQLAGLG